MARMPRNRQEIWDGWSINLVKFPIFMIQMKNTGEIFTSGLMSVSTVKCLNDCPNRNYWSRHLI